MNFDYILSGKGKSKKTKGVNNIFNNKSKGDSMDKILPKYKPEVDQIKETIDKSKKVEVHYHIYPQMPNQMMPQGIPRARPKKDLLSAFNGTGKDPFRDQDKDMIPDAIDQHPRKKDLIYTKALKSIYREEQGWKKEQY